VNLSLGKEKSHEPHGEHGSRSPKIKMTQPEEFDLVILGGGTGSISPSGRLLEKATASSEGVTFEGRRHFRLVREVRKRQQSRSRARQSDFVKRMNKRKR